MIFLALIDHHLGGCYRLNMDHLFRSPKFILFNYLRTLAPGVTISPFPRRPVRLSWIPWLCRVWDSRRVAIIGRFLFSQWAKTEWQQEQIYPARPTGRIVSSQAAFEIPIHGVWTSSGWLNGLRSEAVCLFLCNPSSLNYPSKQTESFSPFSRAEAKSGPWAQTGEQKVKRP